MDVKVHQENSSQKKPAAEKGALSKKIIVKESRESLHSDKIFKSQVAIRILSVSTPSIILSEYAKSDW